MCASIREFGFKIPPLAGSDSQVVVCHLRRKTTRQFALAEIPVIPCNEWTQAQLKAFRLLVNRSANWTERDQELLVLEAVSIIDLGETGP